MACALGCGVFFFVDVEPLNRAERQSCSAAETLYALEIWTKSKLTAGCDVSVSYLEVLIPCSLTLDDFLRLTS